MVPVKIQCVCGQKYAFDVEPVGQSVGYAVQCPVCGVDGTPAADLVIANYGAPPVPPDVRLRIGGRQAPITAPTCSSPGVAGPMRSARLSNPTGRSKWFIPALVLGLAGLLVSARAIYPWLAQTKPDKPVGSSGSAGNKLPATLADLNAWYVEPPIGQNAATINLQGFDALQIGTGAGLHLPLLGKGPLPALGAPIPAPVKSAMTMLVRANRDALQLFAKAANDEQSRYPVDLSSGFEAPFPHLPRLKAATSVLELSAILHAEALEGREAANDIRVALALARSLEAEPALLSQSVRAVTISTALATLEQVANRTAVPRESLGELMEAFQKVDQYDAHGDGFNRGLIAERAIWSALLDAPPKLVEALSVPGVEIPPAARDETFATLQKGGRLKAEQRQLEQMFEQLMAARQDSFPARLKADRLVQQNITEATVKKLVVLKVLFSAFAGQSAREAELLARIRLGLAAVALEQFHATHKTYPTGLSQLTPEYLPRPVIDPFDGAPLRFRRTATGYVLYSVGPALRDDFDEQTTRKKDALVFAVRERRSDSN